MNRIITILVLCLILFGLATYELIVVNNIIYTVSNYSTEIEHQIDLNNGFAEVNKTIDELSDYWTERENRLCLMFNHKDLSVITDTITRLKGFAVQSEYSDAYVEAKLLKHYAEKCSSIMGFNFNNLF